MRDALREALTTALAVVLHEHRDPGCTGEPDYEDTQTEALYLIEDIYRQPNVRAALAALAARFEPDCALRIQLADGTWTRGCDAARSEPGAEGLVRAALTSEDEIAHGEAVWERVTGEGFIRTGKCAYCDDEWPCRTQRGIDRLLAALAETEPKPAPETTFDPVTGRYPPRESVTDMLAAMNDAATEPKP